MRSTPRLLLALSIAALGAVGCSEEPPMPSIALPRTHALAQLPDCELSTVAADYAARPADVDGFYVVLDGARAVCATDFDGLQALAEPYLGRIADPTLRPPGARPVALVQIAFPVDEP